LVHRVGVRANRREVLDHVGLRPRLPSVRVRRVMKRLRSPPVLRSTVGSVGYQEFGYRTTKCGSSHVEGRVASVEVVRDSREEKCPSLLPRRTNWRRHGGKRWAGVQAIRDFVHRTVDHESNEIKKG